MPAKAAEKKTYYVYILHCINNTYYTGYTTDLKRRYQEHLAGSAKCKYTRSFKPTSIAASFEIIGTKADAMRLEREIKKLTRKQKDELVQTPKDRVDYCSFRR